VHSTLVHRGLWSGSASLIEAEGATLYDPAMYFGDREVDLAMARLLGGFPNRMFEAYG